MEVKYIEQKQNINKLRHQVEILGSLQSGTDNISEGTLVKLAEELASERYAKIKAECNLNEAQLPGKR